MKPQICLLTLFFAASGFADDAPPFDLTTLSGKKYLGVTVTRVEGDAIAISHADGIARVFFADLPPDLRTKYGYDPNKAAAAIAQRAEAMARQRVIDAKNIEAEKQLRDAPFIAATAEKQNAARDVIAKSTHTIREVATDQVSFLGKSFYLDGELELSSYYNWGYEKAVGTHYSFTLRNGRASCHLYMEREKADGLRKRLVEANGPLKGIFYVTLLRNRTLANGIGDLLLELLDYGPPLE